MLLEHTPPPCPLKAGATPQVEKVLILERTPERVLVEASTREGGFLVLGDAYDPGWRAWAGDVELPVLPAYGLVRCVELPAGTWRVEFRYRSSVRIGIAISALGLLALGVLGWRFLR